MTKFFKDWEDAEFDIETTYTCSVCGEHKEQIECQRCKKKFGGSDEFACGNFASFPGEHYCLPCFQNAEEEAKKKMKKWDYD